MKIPTSVRFWSAGTTRILWAVLALFCSPGTWAQNANEFELVASIGNEGNAVGQFQNPEGVSVDALGRLVVADTGNHRIQVCTEDGSCTTFGQQGDAVGSFNQPKAVWMDRREGVQERAVIADSANARVQACALNGTCELTPTIGNLKDPWGLIVDAQGKLIIADTGNHRIVICDPQGMCTTFGFLGAALGEFELPGGIALLDGKILIPDRLNHRIQSCTYEGECTSFGTRGGAWGQFLEPSDVAITNDGWIVVADTGNHRIQLCNANGMCQDFGRFGSEPGSFWDPIGVAVDQRNRIVVVERGTHRVQIFARGGDRPAPNGAMNDAWFNSLTPGQGIFVDVFTDKGLLYVMWFTFDTERPDESVEAKLGGPGQRWYTAQGSIGANGEAQMDIHLTSGGVFNQGSPMPSTQVVGTATMRFDSCREAELMWQLTTPENSGNMQVQRIVIDNVALCDYLSARQSESTLAIKSFGAHRQSVESGEIVALSWDVEDATQCRPSRGTGGWSEFQLDPVAGLAEFQVQEVGVHEFTLECSNGSDWTMKKTLVRVQSADGSQNDAFKLNEGLNGSWYNPALAGQGIHVTVWPELKQVFMGWFTFDTERPPGNVPAVIGEPGHRWLTAQGGYSEGTARLFVTNSTGGVFNSAEPRVTNTPYGQVSVEFHSCTSATMTWNLDAIGNQGELQLQRLTDDNVALCEALSGLSASAE